MNLGVCMNIVQVESYKAGFRNRFIAVLLDLFIIFIIVKLAVLIFEASEKLA